jgi:serine/threonine protein kinase
VETETGTGRSLLGTTLDSRYQIDEVIGQGGMSTVYRARHLFLKRDVAIKVMQDHLSNTEGRLRFQREAQAVASLSHPNIISVSEFGVSGDGEPYMVMDYLNGPSLADMLRDRRRGEPGLCILIFNQVAAALQHAHEKGILHRDLKPSNVMLVRSEQDNAISVRVVDFGLARFLPGMHKDHIRLTAAGELVGSPYYMSPEQIRDEELDARSDIYSLGCLMYEALTGCRPFTDTNAITVLSMHLYEEPPPFAMVLKPNRIPGRLEAIVRRCLEKSRTKRYQTMKELSADLEAVNLWEDGPAESTPMNFSNGAPYTPPIVRIHDTNSGVRRLEVPDDRRSPAISQVTGTYDMNTQYTLRLQKPQFARNRFLYWLRNMAAPLLRLINPPIRKVAESWDGRGADARKQRLTGTRVLIAVLGDSKDLITEAETDAAKYSVYYKNIAVRKSMNAQEFLVLLSTENFDIVHLHGTFDKHAIFKDSTGFALRLSDVKRACDFAKVKLLWLASTNKLEWLTDSPVLEAPSFNVVVTSGRGPHYPKFLSSVMSRLSRGDSLINSWGQVIPNMQQQGQKVDVRLVTGPVEISFLP